MDPPQKKVGKKRHRSLNSKKCYAFERGNCQFGDSCKFRHSTMANDAMELPEKKLLSTIGQEEHIYPLLNKTEDIVEETKEPSNDVLKSHLTEETFSSLPISPNLIRAIEEKMGYSKLTEVQSQSLPHILAGKDCLARAKTGTGKTLAFLIPAIERILVRNEKTKGQQGRNVISTLILSPTRELANQIGKEASTLLHFLPHHRVVTITGGTNRNSDVRKLQESITILVATPGRLVDHLDNTEGIAMRCQHVDTLVLDEADVLLEMGFKPALDRIMKYLGQNDARQTLLFSATIPPPVQQIAATVLHSGYSTIDTIGHEAANHTHEHVQQNVLVSTMEELIPTIYVILTEQMTIPNYKIIVFFTTARLTGYMAALFRNLPQFSNLLEIHSRKSQSFRTKSSEQFRTLRHSILFSSDVSARGMDYPDVTFVLQVGLTEKEQYIHRLGRTARAGKSGSGTLLLYDFEESSMLNKTLKNLPIERQILPVDVLNEAARIIQQIIDSTKNNFEMKTSGEQAYQAWLGFYNSHLRVLNWDKSTVVAMANKFSQIIGFSTPPALEAKTIGKMGLKGVSGLVIQRNK